MVTIVLLLITLLLVATIPTAVDALSSSSSSSSSSSVRTTNNSISQTIINSISAKAKAAAAIPAPSVVSPKIQIKTKFILIDTINCGNIGSAARAMKTMGFNTNLILVNPKDGLNVKRKKRTKESTSGAIDVLQNSRIFMTLDEALDCPFDDDEDGNNSKEISSMNEDEKKQDEDEKKQDDNTTNENENNIITIVCGTGMPIDMSREREEQLYIPPRQFFEELLLLSSASASAASASASAAASTAPTTTTVTLHLSLLFGNEKYGMDQNDIQHYCPIMLGIPTNPKFGSLNLASAVQIIAYDWRMAMHNAQ